MANPVLVALPLNTWTKVATNVTNGMIYVKQYQPTDYVYTNVTTGGAAPTDESVSVILRSWTLAISSTSSIDVYMKCVSQVGAVVVNL